MKITKKHLVKLIKEQTETQGVENAMKTMEENNALDSLTKLFQPMLGFAPKFNMKIRNKYINIESNDFADKLDKIGKLIFKKITIDFWGGDYNSKENQVYFSPHMSYTHPGGGTNGIAFGYDYISYDCTENKWIKGSYK